MRNAILTRISRRNYLPKSIEAALREQICAKIDAWNRVSGLSFAWVDDAAQAFRSMRKSYGMFSGVRAAVVLKGAADTPELAEKIGYYGEALVLDLTDLGLGTCWVGGTFDRAQFAVPQGERMLCVLTVGHVAAPSMKEKFIRGALSRKRKPVSQRLRGDAPAWVIDAMEAVRLAPSAVNSQKPVFTYANGAVTAAVDDAREMDLIDLGIAKLHFAQAAGGRFAFGQNGAFVPGEDAARR